METFIAILLETVRNEFKKPPPPWQQVPLEPTDLQFLDRECNQTSEFDPTNKRQTMYKNLVQGKAPVVIAQCPYGQVTAVLESSTQRGDIPWALWGRILRLYTEKIGNTTPFKVFLLASTSLRQFPSGTKPITPENINGGYTYRCQKDTILLYRAEDATRVLLHELQHSCCLDHPEQGVDQVEAETEAWAELLWVALLSEGDPHRFQTLLSRQRTWMVTQNEEVKKHRNSPTSKGPMMNGSNEGVRVQPFPWRYTLGKEEVWRRWGLFSCGESSTRNSSSSSHMSSSAESKAAADTVDAVDAVMVDKRSKKKEVSKNTVPSPRKSLRLTFPVDATLKRRFHVKDSSTML